MKRLIGVDGDWVRPRGNRHNVLRVPEGCCWVEGDNHGVSEDSNQFGPVSLRGRGELSCFASAGSSGLVRTRVGMRFPGIETACRGTPAELVLLEWDTLMMRGEVLP